MVRVFTATPVATCVAILTTDTLSSPSGEMAIRLHSICTSSEVHCPSSSGVAVQIIEKALLTGVVTDSGEVSTKTFRSVRLLIKHYTVKKYD